MYNHLLSKEGLLRDVKVVSPPFFLNALLLKNLEGKLCINGFSTDEA